MDIFKKMKQEKKLNFDNIIAYIEEMKEGLDSILSPVDIYSEIQKRIHSNLNVDPLEDLIVDIAMSKSTLHPDYSILASRIFVSTLNENTKSSFVEKMEDLYNNTDSITEEEIQIIKENRKRIEDTIDYERDYSYGIFNLKALEGICLARINNQVVERPQDFLMRIAIGIHKNNIDEVVKTYNYMTEGWFFHFPSRLTDTEKIKPCPIPPHSIAIETENISTLFNQLNYCAQIAQSKGEIGIAIHDVPSKVVIPTLHLFNETVTYLNQEKEISSRPFTMYLEPWHSTIFNFLKLNKGNNNLGSQASNLNCALWIPDLFMERVENNDDWTLMCPSECPGLSNTYGKEFETLYKKYEAEGKGQRTIKAQNLWFKILETQIEIGSYLLLFKDSINKNLNQSQPNTIKAPGYSNIKSLPFFQEREINVSSVSIALPKFADHKRFDLEKLYEVIYRVTIELNYILEHNQTQNKGNLSFSSPYIPIHIEIQGLAETFLKLKIPFHSEEAKQINKELFETIQFAALTASNELAKTEGSNLPGEEDSKLEDFFQFDFWNIPSSTRWNWENLKEEVKMFGLCNRFKIVLSPTSETSKILGNCEESSPLSSYIKTKQWSSGNEIIVNKYLLEDLIQEGIWNKSMLQKIIQHQGSIQDIIEIPESLREVYKTAWEIPQIDIVDMASDREYFGIQSESMEVFIENPNFEKLTSIYFYSWRKGLRTSISHLSTKISPEAMQLSINRNISFNILKINDV